MRDLTRKARCEMHALENMLQRSPEFQRALVSDYAIRAAQLHGLRTRFEVLIQPPSHRFIDGHVTPISPRRGMDVPDVPGGPSSDFLGCIA